MNIKILSKNIRKFRSARELTQEKVANDLNCSLNTYTKIERGETNVPFLRLVQIAEYLKVDVADLVREEGEVDIKDIKKDIITIKNDIKIIKEILDK